MAVNNRLNINTTGIQQFDSTTGVFSSISIPVSVSNGGTGVSSATAYTVSCAGTSSTNPLQQVSGLGTTEQGLVSSGSSSLPTFTNYAGYTFTWVGFQNNPADATTYYIANGFAISTTASLASTRFYVPFACTLTAAYGTFTCTTGSSESATLKLTINGTTDVNISTSLNFSSSPVTFSNTFSQAVSAGDYVEVKFVTPTWATNPTFVKITITVYFS